MTVTAEEIETLRRFASDMTDVYAARDALAIVEKLPALLERVRDAEKVRDGAIARWSRAIITAAQNETTKEIVALRAAAGARLSDEKIDAASRIVCEWIGYSWDGLGDCDVSYFPDWCLNGVNHKQFQGGKPALRKLVTKMWAEIEARHD